MKCLTCEIPSKAEYCSLACYVNRKKSKRKKYGNETCKCVRGHIHDSRGEARYCTELYYQLMAGEIVGYDIQCKYPLVINRKSYGYMRVDFEVVDKNHILSVHEYKGMPTASWRIKVKLFKQCYPKIEYKVIWHKNYSKSNEARDERKTDNI